MPNVISDLANHYAYKRNVPSTDGKDSVEIEPQRSETAKISHEQESVERSALDSNELVSKIENLNQLVTRDLEFSVDDETGQQVLRVLDSKTGELIRQVPSDQILHVISQVQKATEGMLQGVLLDDKF
ncbi:MAG: flagellar protein FlaG [Candidatus Thiodiazotropha sp.]